jgi:hypothetical protein
MEEKEICNSILCIGSPLSMGLSMHCPHPPTLPWATILGVGTRDLSLGCCLGRGLSLFTMDFMWSFQPPLQGTIDMSSWVYLTQPLFKILMRIVQIVKTIPEWKGTCLGQWTSLLGSTWPNHCSISTGLFYKIHMPIVWIMKTITLQNVLGNRLLSLFHCPLQNFWGLTLPGFAQILHMHLTG